MKKYFILLIMIFSTLGMCLGQALAKSPATKSSRNKNIKIDAEWNKFWSEFQKAATNLDLDTIEKMSQLDESTQEIYNQAKKNHVAKKSPDHFSLLFDPDVRKCFSRSKPKLRTEQYIGRIAVVTCNYAIYGFTQEKGSFKWSSILFEGQGE